MVVAVSKASSSDECWSKQIPIRNPVISYVCFVKSEWIALDIFALPQVAVMKNSGKFVICDRGNERSRMQIFTKHGHFVR